MEKLIKETVLEELTTLDMCQAIRRSNEQMMIVADRYFDILSKQHISDDVFREAILLHQSQSVYFPQPKDILDRCQEVWAERQRNIKRLDEPIPDMTPEQIKEFADRARAAAKGLFK